MTRSRLRHLVSGLAVLFGLGSPSAASATLIEYELTNLSGNRWEYAYTVTNDSLGSALEELTIYFDATLFENLAVTGSPVGWDSLVVQPDLSLPDDGFFDSLSTLGGLAPAGSQSGFRVAFDFLGTGTPGAQPFEIVDPITFAVLDSGQTTAVPEPGSAWLLVVAAAALGLRRARRSAGAALLGGCVAASAAALDVTGQANIASLELVSSTRVSRTVFEYTYRIRVANVGDDLGRVIGTVSSSSPATEIVDMNCEVGDVPAGGTVLSSDTFTIRHDRTVPFDAGALVWELDAQTAVPSALRLNEVRFSPLAGDAPFAELWNSGSRSISLGTFRLTNEQGDVLALPGSVTLAPGGFALVLFDGQSGVSGVTIHALDATFLSSPSGALELVGPAGFPVDRVAWGELQAASVTQGGGGFSVDPPAGASIARAPTVTTAGSSGWTVAGAAQVTPGSANPTPGVQTLLPFSGTIIPGPQVELAWYPVPGASSYRAQLASDASFTTILSDQVVTSPQLSIPTVTAGTHYWRVQAIASGGATSVFSNANEITVDPTSTPITSVAASSARSPRLKRKASRQSALSPTATSAAVLVVPLSQRKDTRMLLLESQREHGAHGWSVAHSVFDPSDDADNMNCAAASIAMVNRFFGGRLSQDRISYEVFRNREPGPEQDLSYGGSGFSSQQVTSGLTFALGGPSQQGMVTSALQGQFWQLLQQEIDAGRPIVLGAARANGQGHATVLVGYRDAGGGDLRISHIDPWVPGSSSGTILQLRLSSFIAQNNRVFFWTVPAVRQPVSDEPEIAQDSDNDGVVDFDETRRFGTDPFDPDTDGDFVNDFADIRASVFDLAFGYSLGGNTSRVDIDGDNAQMELDADSDGDNCTDGQEDFTLNGDYEPLLDETHNFDSQDKRCRSWIGTTRFVQQYKHPPFARIQALGRLEWTPNLLPFPIPVSNVSFDVQGDMIIQSFVANGCRATLTPNSTQSVSGFLDIDYTMAPAVATGQAGSTIITTLTDCQGNSQPGTPIGAVLFEGPVTLNVAQDSIRWTATYSDQATEYTVEMNYNLAPP